MDWDQLLEKPRVLYQGHLWDAPFLDHALPADLIGQTCQWCEEKVGPNDDAIRQATVSHLECLLLGALGSVAHLEGRCSCYRGTADEHDDDFYPSIRDEARATLRWLLKHNRGRFKPT